MEEDINACRVFKRNLLDQGFEKDEKGVFGEALESQEWTEIRGIIRNQSKFREKDGGKANHTSSTVYRKEIPRKSLRVEREWNILQPMDSKGKHT